MRRSRLERCGSVQLSVGDLQPACQVGDSGSGGVGFGLKPLDHLQVGTVQMRHVRVTLLPKVPGGKYQDSVGYGRVGLWGSRLGWGY